MRWRSMGVWVWEGVGFFCVLLVVAMRKLLWSILSLVLRCFFTLFGGPLLGWFGGFGGGAGDREGGPLRPCQVVVTTVAQIGWTVGWLAAR
jgi:hypothetical protein